MENMQFLQFFVGKFEQQIYNSVHKPACFNQIVSIYPTEVAFLVSFLSIKVPNLSQFTEFSWGAV